MDEEEEGVSGEYCTRVGGGGKCGRWNPTAEQVKMLTDLFRSGLRTPSTEQIQKISSHLSSYGKIESKNVFYWFQNHKARERHHKKRRRSDLRLLSPDCTREARTCSWEREREIETLELFPLRSYDVEADVRTVRNERDEVLFLAGKDPPLDLRLSFL